MIIKPYYIHMPIWKKDLVRSVTGGSGSGGSGGAMPSSPADLKLTQISPPPPPMPAPANTTTSAIPPPHSHKIPCQSNDSLNGNHSPPNHSSSATTVSPPSPPNSHLTPASHHMPNTADPFVTGSLSVRQISKLKRFLTTLYQFAIDISSEVGDRVRGLIIGLVNSTITTEEFHQKIQETTNYPLRPYVIPFLKLHLPILQNEISHYSRLAKVSPAQYLRQHESLIIDSNLQTTNCMSVGEPFEIFQPIDQNKEVSGKRRPSPETRAKENGYSDAINDRDSGPPVKKHQPMLSPSIGSRLSPAGLTPLLMHGGAQHPAHHIVNPSILHSHLSARSMFDESANPYHSGGNREPANGRNHSAEHLSDRYASVAERFEREYCRPTALYTGLQRDSFDDRDMEDEWKNIHTMLNCILGMVEKTKRAMTLLQHRSENVRSAEFAASAAMWNLSALRGRHYNPLDVTHAHEFHDIKKPRVDNLLSTIHYPKNASSDIDRLSDIRRSRGTANLEEAVNEVKRQAVVELQKAVSAAETKASELVASERAKMEKMISDARRQATEETLANISHQDDSTENCWNCGRKASETCSGCNIARYCGSFCQHKDWENHHRVCQNTSSTNGANAPVAQSTINAEKQSKSRSPTPASGNVSGNNGKNAASVPSNAAAGDLRDKKE